MSKEKVQILPCNIVTTAADLLKAKVVLVSDDNYITRYIRTRPTVGLGKIPARNVDGAVIADADPSYRRVICSGTPLACMIAFKHEDKLLVGWSKRIDLEDETAFSKKDGRTAAVIRALKDTIEFTPKGNFVTSAASGPIPHDVARNLRWFVGQAEQAYGEKAANVSHPNQELTVAKSNLPVA